MNSPGRLPKIANLVVFSPLALAFPCEPIGLPAPFVTKCTNVMFCKAAVLQLTGDLAAGLRVYVAYVVMIQKDENLQLEEAPVARRNLC